MVRKSRLAYFEGFNSSSIGNRPSKNVTNLALCKMPIMDLLWPSNLSW